MRTCRFARLVPAKEIVSHWPRNKSVRTTKMQSQIERAAKKSWRNRRAKEQQSKQFQQFSEQLTKALERFCYSGLNVVTVIPAANEPKKIGLNR